MAKVSRSSGGGSRSVIGNSAGKTIKADVGKGAKAEKNSNININHSPFLDAINEVEINFTKGELEKSLSEINEYGKELLRKPTMEKLAKYKGMVRSYVKEAMKKMYKVENKLSLKKFGQEQKVFVSVEKVDIILDSMTREFVKGEQEAMGLIHQVEGIQGLLYNMLA